LLESMKLASRSGGVEEQGSWGGGAWQIDSFAGAGCYTLSCDHEFGYAGEGFEAV
jgi:hypothetical protein